MIEQGDKIMLVLASDIGGTTTRMQITDFTDEGKTQEVKQVYYNNSDYDNFTDILETFLSLINLNQTKIAAVCLSVAGPINEGEVKCTNLSWIIKIDEIKKRLKIDHVTLINDFVAIGYGVETLKPQDLCVLQAGRPQAGGVKACLGAGTGLGVGFTTYNRGVPKVYPTEGGHVDFAPTDDIQVELLKSLRQKYHRVSFERVLSGPGLINIYCFVRSYKGFREKENPNLALLINGKKQIDLPALITEYAIRHSDPLALRALNIFIRIYGAVAGNLALTTLPFGGLYIASGIAPKLLSLINSEQFLEAFSDKGRMSDLIKEIPLYVVLNKNIGLQGAALYAKLYFSQGIS